MKSKPSIALRFAAALLLFCAALAVRAQDTQQLTLHLLDYVGVDYAEAIEDGKVKNADEYKEMLEFAGRIGAGIAAFPESPRKPELIAQAAALSELVTRKAAPTEVAAAATALRQAIVGSYKLRLAPRREPDLAAGRALYATHCAGCHGAEGRGDGPASKGLDPPPSNFHDAERMQQRSLYGLYNTVTLGVADTSMAAYAQLTEDERWALAFHVANLGVAAEQVRAGEQLWRAGQARAVFPDLENLATLSAIEMAARHGEQAARVQDYLRAHPGVLRPAPLDYARQKLAEALDAVRKGESARARTAAISAYLEGFELVEAPLANVDDKLMRAIEREMLELRAAIERGEAIEAYERRSARVDALLASAQDKLGAGELSSGAAFGASLLILLREGLEAMLVLAAIIAFVVKSGRRDALPYVHAGWIAALALGAATWVAATFLFEISGANRELTEGVTALAAAAMLLYVGWWLHAKSYAEAWTAYIRQQVGQALARRTLWALAAVSFLAVYREAFEVVLFYQALWAQANAASRPAVLAGAGAAVLLLVAIGIALLRFSLRLPLGLMLGLTSALLALLAVIFTGHGIAALQEAGVLARTGLDFEPFPLLGIYPSREALAAQLAVLVLIGAGWLVARRSAPRAA